MSVAEESEQLRRSWIANAEAWRDAVRERRIESRRLVTDAAIVGVTLEQKPRRVLDLGCGEGWLSRELAAHDIAVVGVDSSVPLIESARQSGGAEFIALSYDDIVADPSGLGSRFDVIVANFSLLDDRTEPLLKSLRSAGGRLIIQTIHPLFAGEAAYADGWRTENFRALPGEWREPMPWYFRTLSSWTRLLANAGYLLLEVREPMYPDRPAPASILFIADVRH